MTETAARLSAIPSPPAAGPRFSRRLQQVRRTQRVAIKGAVGEAGHPGIAYDARAVSSAGQSACLTSRRSLVRSQHRPLRKVLVSSRF